MNPIKSILLVENDSKDVELHLHALEEFNLTNRIVVARDGVEALDYLYRRGHFAERVPGNPVAIWLDLNMPKLNGLEVLRQLKSDETMRTIPVVVLSASREPKDLQECYALGVNAYLVKPIHFEEFTQMAKNLGLFWALYNEPPPEAET
jgi:CheY-like chemotaxis protein